MKQNTKQKKFLNPEELLSQLDIEEHHTVADFGCGNGYYSVAAAKQSQGKAKVLAVDILEKCLSNTASQARLEGLHNISTIQCNLEKPGDCEIEDASCDFVIISNILHMTKDDDNVLREAYRVLKTSGKAVVIEWNKSAPLGPKSTDKISEKEAREKLEALGFRPDTELEAGSFHYAIVYEK